MAKKTFEENMARLEEIVALLEKGDAQLSQSLSLFEEGTRLAAPEEARRSSGRDGTGVPLPQDRIPLLWRAPP